MLKKAISNLTLFLILLIFIFVGISYTLYEYVVDISNKEAIREKLKEKILKNDNEDNFIKQLNNVKIKKVKVVKVNENNKLDKQKEVEKTDNAANTNKKVAVTNTGSTENINTGSIIDNKERKDKNILLSGNICFFGIKNLKFYEFISRFDYRNEGLISRIRYNKQYKPYLKNLFINYVCFQDLKYTKDDFEKIKEYKNKIDKMQNLTNDEKTAKFLNYLDIYFKLHSKGIIKGTIIKDLITGKLEEIDGCLFKNFRKLLLGAGIYIELDEYRKLVENNCFINSDYKIYKLSKPVDTKKYYELLFKSTRNYYKNRKGTYFADKTYYVGLADFVNYLLNKKQFFYDDYINYNINEEKYGIYLLDFLNKYINKQQN